MIIPTQIANLESKLTEILQTLDKVNFENFLSSTETKYSELLKRMSKLETEIKKINNKNLEKSNNSVDEGNLIEKIQKIVKDSLNSFVVDKDLLDSKDKQINLLMEELEEKTKEIQKLKKNKAEKDEVNRLKQALSSKEQELNACKTQLSKKDNFEQELNDMVTVLREKQNENARIHAELYNMQNELLRLRSVENELTSKSKELESCKKECDQLAITLSEKNDIIHDLLIKSKESIIPASSQTNTPDKVVNNDLESMHQTDLNETPKRVVLLGDSLLKQVIPERLLPSGYDGKIDKYEAYRIDDIANAVENEVLKDADVILLHSGTNDIKTETSETCLDKMTSTVAFLQEINPDVKIILSNIAPRGDAEVLDINRQEFNIKLLKEYSLDPDVTISDNNNLSRHGSIIEKFYGRDNVHLNREGTKILASNISKSLKAVLGIKQQFKRSNRGNNNRNNFRSRHPTQKYRSR